MTELEKLKAGLEYCYDDAEVEALKLNAIRECKAYNSIDDEDYAAQSAQLKKMLGGVGEKVWIAKTFNCDKGKNIFIGSNFTGNYNLTILDIREVRIGNNVVIGAGAVVSRDIPDNSVAVGVPARVVKAIENDCE